MENLRLDVKNGKSDPADGAADGFHGGVEDLVPLTVSKQRLERLPVLAVDHRLEGGFGQGLQPAGFDQSLARLLAGRGVEEEGEQHRRRAVDGHRDRGFGVAQVEARVELLGVLDGADRDPRLADLAVDVGAGVGVGAVEGDRVEGGGEAGGGLALGQQVEARVGTLGAV